MLTKKGLYDLIRHKHSINGNDESPHDHAAPSPPEQPICSPLDDFPWGDERGVQSDCPPRDTMQGFDRNGRIELSQMDMPRKGPWSNPDSPELNQDAANPFPNSVSHGDSVQNTRVEDTHPSIVDSHSSFESGEPSEGCHLTTPLPRENERDNTRSALTESGQHTYVSQPDLALEPGDFTFKSLGARQHDDTRRPSRSSGFAELKSRVKPLLDPIRNVPVKQYLIPALMIMAAIVLLYPSSPTPYSVETRLFFISGDGYSPDPEAWSLDKEKKYFNNTNVLYASAQKIFGGQQDPYGPQVTGKSKAHDQPIASSVRQVVDGRERFKSSGEFMKWFLKSSSLDADFSSVPARINFRLIGQDPAFLKTVSESYVRSYVEFRRTLQPPVSKESKSEQQSVQSASQQAALKSLNDRLQNMDFMEREYELSLKLIDSGKSAFSGFVPKENMLEPGSLTNFQQKIVQLELNKNSLKLKFAAESREVRGIEQEIQSAKHDMRQCVVEQLRFIKQNKEMLVAQKSELEKTSTQDSRPSTISVSPGRLATTTGDGPIFLSEGLYLLVDHASVVDKPMIVKVGDFVKDTVAGNIYQSVANVRGLKDSLTGLYQTLVSEESRGVGDVTPSRIDTATLKKGLARTAFDGR